MKSMRLGAVTAYSLLLLVTAIVSLQSTISLLLWGTAAFLVHRFLFRGQEEFNGMAVFVFYSWAALILYLAQLWTYPEYCGFSGPGFGIGTDDSYFYSQVARGLPWDFPVRQGYFLVLHPYSVFLRTAAAPLYLVFNRTHPLDFLYFNTFGLSLLPVLTARIAGTFFRDSRTTRVAFWTVLLCPFIMSNGVILMRDGLVATMFAGAIWSSLQKRWLVMLVFMAGTLYLRLASGIMLAGSLLVLGPVYFGSCPESGGWRRLDGFLRFLFPVVFVGSVLTLAVVLYLGFNRWDEIFRSDFLNTTLRSTAAQDTGTSTFYRLSALPWPLRLPLALVFYIGSPFLSLQSLHIKELWIPRSFLTNAFALVFPLYAAMFTRGILRAFKSRHLVALALVAVFIFDMVLVSQASMQLRHKIPLMPLFYILVGYGATSPYDQHRSIGWFVAVLVVAADVIVTALQVI
jgi:hypothetical protein